MTEQSEIDPEFAKLLEGDGVRSKEMKALLDDRLKKAGLIGRKRVNGKLVIPPAD